MTPAQFARSLAQLRDQAQVLAAGIESLRLALEEMQPEPEPPAEVDGQCQHPPDGVQPAPVMGSPSRMHCGRCGEFFNEGD